MRKFLGWVLIAAGCALMACVLIYSMPHLMDYVKSAREYDRIRDEYIDDPDEEDKTEEPYGEWPFLAKTPDETETEEGKEKNGTEKGGALSRGEVLAKRYPAPKVKGKELKEKNPDYVGWIYIPGTGISYPAVWTDDNDTYLHKGFDGSYSFAGTIFLDERNKEKTDEKHMILYGHNMRDGSMFNKIKSYADEGFLKKHPVFWFITPERSMLFEIFTAYTAQPRDIGVTYSVQGEEFSTDEEYADILEKMAEKSDVDTGIRADSTDQTMTLSTCTNAHVTRYTVSGKLVYEKAAE